MVNTRSTLSGEISEVPDKGIRAQFVLGSMASIRAGSVSSLIHQMEDLSCLTRSLIEDVKQLNANQARDHQELKKLLLDLHQELRGKPTQEHSPYPLIAGHFKPEISEVNLTNSSTAIPSALNAESNKPSLLNSSEVTIATQSLDFCTSQLVLSSLASRDSTFRSNHSNTDIICKVFDKSPHKDLFLTNTARKVFDEIFHKNLFACSEYFDSDLLATYELIARYERANHSCHARRIFELIPKRIIVLFNSVLWNNPCLNWVEFPFDPGGNSISV